MREFKHRGWKEEVADLKKGDYVLATKFEDGNGGDHWVVGFFDGPVFEDERPQRWHIRDGNGNLFRHNGFRRVKKISAERGNWLVKNMKQIERLSCGSGFSVWHFARWKMKKYPEI